MNIRSPFPPWWVWIIALGTGLGLFSLLGTAAVHRGFTPPLFPEAR